MLTPSTYKGQQSPYDKAFYNAMESVTVDSARVIVPLVMKLVQPKRVIDVGCGRGIWLREFGSNGVGEIFGVDGQHVPPADLLVSPQYFRAIDLAQPFQLGGQYDLAICLEVAEHLPAKSAKSLIRSLVASAPIILFSAAVPGQGGTHHINEQWPPYWERLFNDVGYSRLDPIRRHIINDERVATWYRRNVFVYASEQKIAESPTLQCERDYLRKMPFEYVDKRIAANWMSATGVLKELPRTFLRAFKNRLYR
jgi:SAM-dependent methyltransferase